MKKRTFVFTLIIVLIVMVSPASAADTFSPAEKGQILYQYTKEDLDSVVFTMDLFNSAFTREDVANMVSLNKAAKAESTYKYVSYTATEEEIDDYYAEIESIALAQPALSYYFSNVYWRMGTIMYQGSLIDTIILTLTPTSAMKSGNADGYNTAPAWLLVERECGNSIYWTNESSIYGQFDCHAQGEILVLRGIIAEGVIGDWDIEPIRPHVGPISYLINKCNPDGSGY